MVNVTTGRLWLRTVGWECPGLILVSLDSLRHLQQASVRGVVKYVDLRMGGPPFMLPPAPPERVVLEMQLDPVRRRSRVASPAVRRAAVGVGVGVRVGLGRG